MLFYCSIGSEAYSAQIKQHLVTYIVWVSAFAYCLLHCSVECIFFTVCFTRALLTPRTLHTDFLYCLFFTVFFIWVCYIVVSLFLRMFPNCLFSCIHFPLFRSLLSSSNSFSSNILIFSSFLPVYFVSNTFLHFPFVSSLLFFLSLKISLYSIPFSFLHVDWQDSVELAMYLW